MRLSIGEADIILIKPALTAIAASVDVAPVWQAGDLNQRLPLRGVAKPQIAIAKANADKAVAARAGEYRLLANGAGSA